MDVVVYALLKSALGKVSSSIAESYSDTSTYGLGTIIVHENQLYKCINAVTIPEDFDINKWQLIDVDTLLQGKADLVDGKVPSSELPSYVSDIVEVETYQDLPNPGESNVIYVVKTPTTATYRWTGSTYIQTEEKSQYYSVKVDSNNITTMSDLRTYINNINNSGLHCFFDFSDFITNAYICTVLVFTQSNVNYCLIFDVINGRTFINYAGYQDNELVQDYANINQDDLIRTLNITSTIMTLSDMNDELNAINNIGHHVLFDVSALNADMYLCSIFIDVTNDLVRISDIVSGKKYVGSYETTKTLYACIQEAKDDICVLYVDCLAPIGDSTSLTGISVIVKDANGLVIDTKTYNGSQIGFQLPLYTHYKVELLTSQVTIGGIVYFAPEKESGQDEGTITSNQTVTYRFSSTEHITTLSAISAFLQLPDINIETKRLALVRTETNSFSVDVTITNPSNSTTYNYPYYVAEIDTYERENGTTFLGARMMPLYCLPDNKVWDEREQEITEDGETFADNLYYFSATSSGVGDKAFTLLVKGTDYQVGDDIDTYESTNSVYVYKHAWNDTNVVRYGSNVYHESNIDKWLNGSGTDWFVQSHVGDICNYKTTPGFLDWLDNTTKSLIQECAYGIYERSGHEVTNNKIFRKIVLPSGTEIAGSVNSNEGTVFGYWKYLNDNTISNNANSNRTITRVTAQSSKQTCWLRSAYRSNVYDAWHLYYLGNVYNGNVYYSIAVVPIFTIG